MVILRRQLLQYRLVYGSAFQKEKATGNSPECT
jgi:hypothetical protein